MDNSTLIIVSGPLFGFIVFVVSSIQTEGVYIRPDCRNINKISTRGLYNLMKAPLNINTTSFRTVWGLYSGLSFIDRIRLLQMNWVFTTGLGLLSSTAIVYLFL